MEYPCKACLGETVVRVAVVHYWLVNMRGGERVVEQILSCYPEADLYTHVIDPAAVSPIIRDRKVVESFVGRFPGARRHYQKYLGFMPRALEELDLTSYDLVISSESGPAKGVIAGPNALHICYCHSPMRYLYDHYPEYRDQLGGLKRIYFSHLSHRLRQWDFISAARVDQFVANSSFVAARIKRVYGRDADIIHPPVDLDAFQPISTPSRDYYLCVSELVRYKRIDLAIEAMRGMDARLLVVGDGEQAKELRKEAPPNVEFRGRVDMETLRALYAGARALIFPGEEDFGIVPVEAMASGTPVIALGSGGARDSVVEGVTGLFFRERSVAAIREAMRSFEAAHFDTGQIVEHARGFSADRFRESFANTVERLMAARR